MRLRAVRTFVEGCRPRAIRHIPEINAACVATYEDMRIIGRQER